MQSHFFKNTSIIVGIVGLFVFASPPTLTNSKITTQKNSSKYVIDTAKSVLNWEVMVHKGEVKFNQGQLTFINTELEVAAFDINMKSIINTDIAHDLLKGTLENVLKSPDIFNVEAFPEAHFELHSATKIDANNYTFSGDFIIFDIGICTYFEGKIETKADSLYFTTQKIALDRTEWGMYYLSKNNLYPKEEEKSMEVPDTIFVQSHIVAYKK